MNNMLLILYLLLLSVLVFLSYGDRLDELINKREKISIEHIFCILLSYNPESQDDIRYRFLNISDNGNSVNTGQMFLKSNKYNSTIVDFVNRNKNLNTNNDWYLNLDSYEIYTTTHMPKLSNKQHLSKVNLSLPQYIEHQYYEPRDYDMLNGFNSLISYYKLQHKTFPNIFGLYSYRDLAEDKRHRNNSYCVVRDENMIQVASYSLPPIFSQNRFFNSSTYVLIPDFTYFSTFHNFHNHGNPKSDVWFNEIENTKAHIRNYSNIENFKSKKLIAIWRGTYCNENCTSVRNRTNISLRTWNPYRTAAVGCHKISNGIDTHGPFISKRDMCNHYKAIISIPGMGIWTWGLKFALLCDSVTMFPTPLTAGGETWESRISLGLLPNVHYLPLSDNASTLCTEIHNHLNFIRNNEERVIEMIKAKRDIILNRLTKEEVLKDFANIMLNYSKVYEVYDWSKSSINFQRH